MKGPADQDTGGPSLERDPFTSDILDARELFGSHEYTERMIAATALKAAADFAAENEEGGRVMANILSVVGVSESGRNLTVESQTADDKYLVAVERFESLTGGKHSPVLAVDNEGYILYASRTIADAIGFEPDFLGDMNFSQLVYQYDKKRAAKSIEQALSGEDQALDIRVVTSNNTIRWMRTSTNVLLEDGEQTGITVSLTDITDLKEDLFKSKKEVREQKKINTFDPLTGVYNRGFADERLDMLETDRRHKKYFPVSILYVDVDNFKSINETLGHKGGDDILKLVASLLKEANVREGDFVARYGGDEFIFVLPNTTEEESQAVLDRVNDIFRAHNESSSMHLSVTIGTATASNETEIKASVVGADKKMLELKKKKKQ